MEGAFFSRHALRKIRRLGGTKLGLERLTRFVDNLTAPGQKKNSAG
jgi:hypothetical protein